LVTRKGIRKKAEQEIWPSRGPSGYQNVAGPHGKKIIEVDTATGRIVQQIF
jgi:hypothetical protein